MKTTEPGFFKKVYEYGEKLNPVLASFLEDVLIIFFFAIPVWWLWNNAGGEYFAAPQIEYRQTTAILLIIKFIKEL